MTIVVIKKDEDFEKAMLDQQYVYVWKEGFMGEGQLEQNEVQICIIIMVLHQIERNELHICTIIRVQRQIE